MPRRSAKRWHHTHRRQRSLWAVEEPKTEVEGRSRPTEFEHWRNDRGKDVDTLLNDLEVEVIMSRDVSAQTSNQWIRQVRAKKS